MRLEDIEFKDQRGLALVVDLALLIDSAETNAHGWYGRTCARASIANATLLLECAANSSLFSLALSGSLVDELDKLPALAKLDYFLFAMSRRHIDRGCRESQLVADVIKLRDHVVHPKPKSGRLAGEMGAQYLDYGTTKALGIPFDVLDWDHAIAVKIADAVLGFLRNFYLEWCALSKGRVTTLLVCREKAMIQDTVETWVQMPADEIAVIAKHTPQVLEFLDLRAAGGA